MGGFGAQEISGLVPDYWWAKSGPGVSGCRAQGSQSLCQPTGEWGEIPGQLTEGPKVSQRWWWPAVREGRGPVGPRAGASLPVGRVGPAMAGCRAVVVLGLGSSHQWAGQGPGFPESNACPLVCEAGPVARSGSLMGRARA